MLLRIWLRPLSINSCFWAEVQTVACYDSSSKRCCAISHSFSTASHQSMISTQLPEHMRKRVQIQAVPSLTLLR